MYKKIKSLIAVMFVGILSVSGLSACSTGAKTADTKDSAIVFTDQRGKEVRLDKPAERIATAVIPSPAIIAAVDGSYDKIVGINESSLKANKGGIIGKIFGEVATNAKTICDSSFVPDMEAILALKPDVVIQWGNMGTEIIEPIEKAGIPVVGLKYGTQEDLETWIDLFGKILGKESRAQEIINGMHTKADAVKNQISQLNVDVTTGIVLSYGEQLSAANKEDYQHYYFEMAGGKQVSDDVSDEGILSKEDLIAWDPEVIMLSAFDESTPDDIYNDEQLKSLSAVKNKRVYKTPLGVYRWQVPCAESPLMWNWVAYLLHPDEYKVDLRTMMKEEIKYLYNYDMTDEDIDHVLRVDVNAGSDKYATLQK
ncbi:MAG: ABC transporter substrate-binding protein [Actinomycetaceae bacterium]|nr:ABC transporter substrate-binding protein [Actinomycetaceae bacterium]